MKPWFIIPVMIAFAPIWIANAVKLADCDFEPNYRCEAIRGAGVVVPPLSVLTVWLDDEE